jgi:hypothetical protein
VPPQPSTATLVVDQNAVTIAAARAFWLIRCDELKWWICQDDKVVVTVHARDKSGNVPIKNVVVRLDAGVKSTNSAFVLESHLKAKFNNDEADLFVTPAEKKRDILARGQASIELAFDKLGAGEYTIPLRFTAANSADDDLQKLTITIKVRDSVFGAIFILICGAVVSFIATRWVVTLRQRAQFLARVRALRPAWLATEEPTLAVIWLRATIRQAEVLSRRYWLTGQKEIDERLTGAETMLGLLNRIRQVRANLLSIRAPMVSQRAIWKLQIIAGQLGNATPTEQDVPRVKSELDKLDEWSSSDKMEALYWVDLLPAIKARVAEVGNATIPEAKKLAKKLKNVIQETQLTLDDKVKAEENYRRLSILWELRNHMDEAERVAGDHKKPRYSPPIEEVYKIVDDAWWKLLKDTTRYNPVIERPPQSTLDPLEAYETLTFSFKAKGLDHVQNSYLVQKKLEYYWTVSLYEDPARVQTCSCRAQQQQAREQEPRLIGTLEAVTTRPQVAQYAPRAGLISVSVTIFYQGDVGPKFCPAHRIPIKRSTDFGALHVIEMADGFAFLVALLTSVVSGVTLFALEPTFGSMKEYLTLFAWAASLDQGKNFLQSLGTRPS